MKNNDRYISYLIPDEDELRVSLMNEHDRDEYLKNYIMSFKSEDIYKLREMLLCFYENILLLKKQNKDNKKIIVMMKLYNNLIKILFSKVRRKENLVDDFDAIFKELCFYSDMLNRFEEIVFVNDAFDYRDDIDKYYDILNLLFKMCNDLTNCTDEAVDNYFKTINDNEFTINRREAIEYSKINYRLRVVTVVNKLSRRRLR